MKASRGSQTYTWDLQKVTPQCMELLCVTFNGFAVVNLRVHYYIRVHTEQKHGSNSVRTLPHWIRSIWSFTEMCVWLVTVRFYKQTLTKRRLFFSGLTLLDEQMFWESFSGFVEKTKVFQALWKKNVHAVAGDYIVPFESIHIPWTENIWCEFVFNQTISTMKHGAGRIILQGCFYSGGTG